MFELFHEMQQNATIASARSAATDAKSTARQSQEEINALNWKVERLLMITEALWRHLKKAENLEDSYLENLVNEIDAEDGQLDGKVSASPPVMCPNCERPTSKNLRKCIYCGTVADAGLFQR